MTNCVGFSVNPTCTRVNHLNMILRQDIQHNALHKNGTDAKKKESVMSPYALLGNSFPLTSNEHTLLIILG